MKITLQNLTSPAVRNVKHQACPDHVLDRNGAKVILGSKVSARELVVPVVPAPDTLFGPRGAALVSRTGQLVVADTGHHRLMIWSKCPDRDYQLADLVIGQPDFHSEGRNARTTPGAATLNVPTGISAENNILAVADAWNHRVLIWKTMPERNNQPADIVLGQRDFKSCEANRGGCAAADTLNWCYGVSVIGGKIFVADTGNRRVLMWNEIPERNGQRADLVIGQEYFECRDDNASGRVCDKGMRWPHSIAVSNGRLFVSDAGNNRVMVWSRLPDKSGKECDFVLGQPDVVSIEHNQSRYWPEANTLNMPYAVASCNQGIVVADTANSRILSWRDGNLCQGASANALSGQEDFQSKGDNKWGSVTRESLCWPYGLTICDDLAVIPDSGNNRVLIWGLAS